MTLQVGETSKYVNVIETHSNDIIVVQTVVETHSDDVIV